MYSGLIFVSKIKPDSLLEVQTFNNDRFFTKADLFSGFCVRKKIQEILVFRKMAGQKRGVSGLTSHIAWVNISPKPCEAKRFNFLNKLYQKCVKQDVLKHRHHFPLFFPEQIQNISKKAMFKKFG